MDEDAVVVELAPEESVSAGDANSESESDSDDDYPSEEKDRFVAQLYKFMDERGTPMNRVPAVAKIDLDLHKFFVVVRKNGGYNKVYSLVSKLHSQTNNTFGSM